MSSTLPTNKAIPGDDPIVVNQLGIRFRDYGAGKRPSLLRKFISTIRGRTDLFWALKDVNFVLKKGDVLCIIGRNGAGKTTLLKVLAQIIFPDCGMISINGDVSAFLSMGLGFQGELSGYDNINLSLSFMGFHRDQIEEVVPDIEEFSRLGKYLYAPVKVYSAGMKARLAFSIATSVNPDILIMDEVINAGDEEFRQRCATRISEFMDTARAIVIATHNMQQALNLASKIMWIEKGKIQFLGDPAEGVKLYEDFISKIRNDPFYDIKLKGTQ